MSTERRNSRSIAARVGALAVCGALLSGAAVIPLASSGGADDAPSPLVVAGVAGLEWSDISHDRTPHLWRMIGSGDVASMSVRTLAPTCPLSAWLTISAGSRVTDAYASPRSSSVSDDEAAGSTSGGDTGPEDSLAAPPDASEVDSGADSAAPLRCRQVPGIDVASADPHSDGTRQVSVAGWKALLASDDADASGTTLGTPGTLGDALKAANQCAVAVGPGAAVALARSNGSVDRYVQALPSTGATEEMTGTIHGWLSECPLAVVDLGELPDGAADRAAAVAALDASVGVLESAASDSRLIVAGIADTPDGPRGLQAAIQHEPGAGTPPAWLVSDSARREGVVVVNDLAATIASAAGVSTASFDGSPLVRGEDRRLDARTTVLNRQYLTVLTDTARPVMWAMIGVLGLALLACVPLLVRRRSLGNVRRGAITALTVAAFLPAAAPLATLSQWWVTPAPHVILVAAMVVGAVLLSLVTWVLDLLWVKLIPDPPWRRPLVIAGFTWIVYTVDGLLGTPLQVGSPLGSSLAEGARFYGFGNMVYAIYAVSAVVVAAGVWVSLRDFGHRTAAFIAGISVAVVTVLVDGLPMFGADAGGIVSLVPAFVVLILLLRGTAMKARHWLIAAGITVAAAVAFGVVAWLLPDGSHLGRFVQRVIDGDALALVAAKMSGAWTTVTTVQGFVGLLAVLALMWAVVLPGRKPWTRLQPLAAMYDKRPEFRAVVITLIVLAVVGSVLNDSGVVVAGVISGVALLVLFTGNWSAGTEAMALVNPQTSRTPAHMVAWGCAAMVAFLTLGVALPSTSSTVTAGDVTGAGATPLVAQDTLVMIGTQGVRWPDINSTDTPTLWDMLSRGADAGGVTAGVVDTNRRCDNAGWLALSAGRTVITGEALGGEFECQPIEIHEDSTATVTTNPVNTNPVTIDPQPGSDEPGNDSPVGQGTLDPSVQTPNPAGSGHVVNWDALVAAQARSAYVPTLGTFGQALADNNVCATAVGTGASIALADKSGAVARTVPLESLTSTMVSQCPLTIIDAGSAPMLGGEMHAERAEALRAVDATIAGILNELPRDATVMVMDVGNPSPLVPVLGVGLVQGDVDTAARYLSSVSTRWEGVVRLLDLPITLVDALGVPQPADFAGTPVLSGGLRPSDDEQTAEEISVISTKDRIMRLATGSSTAIPLWITLALFAVVTLYLPRLAGSSAGKVRAVVEALLLILAALPAGQFLVGTLPWWKPDPASWRLWTALAIATLLVAAVANLAPRRPVWAAPLVITSITFILLTTDAILGTPMHRGSPLGPSPTLGGRFFGFGNPTYSVYVSAGLFVAAALGTVIAKRWKPIWAGVFAAVIGMVAMLISLWPDFGADVGGGLVIVPTFAVLALVLSGLKVTWKKLFLAAFLGVAMVAGIGILDWRRPEAQRTHLGTFIQSVIDGSAWEIIARKGGYAARTLTRGPEAWITMILLLALIAMLVGWLRSRWYQRAKEEWPTLTPLLVSMVVGAVAGGFMNDYGLRIVTIMFFAATPLVALIALRSNDPSSDGDTSTAAHCVEDCGEQQTDPDHLNAAKQAIAAN